MQIHLPIDQLISKSAIDNTSLPNSVLSRQQADAFIDMVIDESILLKMIRVVRTNNASGEINKLDLGSIVTEGASTTSKASTRVPSESVMTYDMVKYRSAFDLRSDFNEDNLERSDIRNKLLGMFTKRIAKDMEIAAIEGDDSLNTGDAQSDENNLLGVNDGFNKIMLNNVPSAQIVDAAGAAPSKALYYEMRRKVPSRYRAAKPDYRWFMPSGPWDKMMLDWSDRETSGGDSALSTGKVPGPWGTPATEIPLMPEDLTFGTAGTDGSYIWLTPPRNLVYFIRREITIEWDRQPRQDLWECTIHTRCDFEIEDPDMIVIAKNVSMSGSDYA